MGAGWRSLLSGGVMSQNMKAKRPGPAIELPAELTQARRFGKPRSAQSTALLQAYVELIADLLAGTGEARPPDVARRLGVSPPTAPTTHSPLTRAALATTPHPH